LCLPPRPSSTHPTPPLPPSPHHHPPPPPLTPQLPSPPYPPLTHSSPPLNHTQTESRTPTPWFRPTSPYPKPPEPLTNSLTNTPPSLYPPLPTTTTRIILPTPPLSGQFSRHRGTLICSSHGNVEAPVVSSVDRYVDLDCAFHLDFEGRRRRLGSRKLEGTDAAIEDGPGGRAAQTGSPRDAISSGGIPGAGASRWTF